MLSTLHLLLRYSGGRGTLSLCAGLPEPLAVSAPNCGEGNRTNCMPNDFRPGLPSNLFYVQVTTAGVDGWTQTIGRRLIRAVLYSAELHQRIYKEMVCCYAKGILVIYVPSRPCNLFCVSSIASCLDLNNGLFVQAFLTD